MIDWNRYHEINALRESGRPAEALVKFRVLRESATDAEEIASILLGESISYRDLRRFAEATEAASKAVSQIPENSPSRLHAEFCLGCCHECEGKFGLSVQEFKSLLQRYADLLKSSAEFIQFRRGIQFRLIANLIMVGHAIEPLSISTALRSEDISAEERSELLYREAVAHGLLERHDRALKLYQEALCGPLDSSLVALAHFHIGEVLYSRGEFSRALDEFRSAEALAEPNTPDKECFANWVKNTLRAVAEGRKEEAGF
jgi:tetratricopeptide (TPR) repeat protein